MNLKKKNKKQESCGLLSSLALLPVILLIVPSAGPKVQVQHISSSAAELVWSPVPVEQRHGFIRNYVIVHWKTNQTPQSEWSTGVGRIFVFISHDKILFSTVFGSLLL